MERYTATLEDVVHFLFDGDYNELFPEYILYDNNHKAELEKKIYDHYCIYEIGMETTEQWLRQFRAKWNEIIPLANKHYQVLATPELLELYNNSDNKHYQLDKTGRGNSGKAKTTGSDLSEFEQTPYSGYPPNTKYTTTRNRSNGTTETDQTRDATSSSQDIYNENRKGMWRMTPAEALEKYMKIIFDVDMWIINQMRELFMEVY